MKTTNTEHLTITKGLGSVWGDDHCGQEWARLYVPAHDNLVLMYKAIEHGWVMIDGDLLKVAEIHLTTDTYIQA